MSRKRLFSPPAPASSDRSPTKPTPQNSTDRSQPGAGDQIFRSHAIKDRASTFIAIFSPRPRSNCSTSTPLSPFFGASLQSHETIETATHRIAAWRKASAQRSILAPLSPSPSSSSESFSTISKQGRLYEVHHDDDREKYAGKRLEKVLVEMDVEGTIVVGRWYGGVLLGPVRFEHIERCAREAILKWKGLGEDEEDRSREAKRKRGEDGERGETAALAAVLRDRDQSIAALRGLLAEKTEEARVLAGKTTVAKQETTSQSAVRVDDITRTDTTPTKVGNPFDYSAMPLPALKRLEKARDATMTWVLKEIETVERQQQQQQQQQQTQPNQDAG